MGGLRCKCGTSLPAAWPHADGWGSAVCLDCLSHETTIPQRGLDATSLKTGVWLDGPSWTVRRSAGPDLLSIAKPTGGAYGHEGKR